MSSAAQHLSEPLLQRHDDAGVTTLTLNRPSQFNALSEELLEDLQTKLDAIARDDTVRAVVVAGNGRAFCAGHDLKQMRERPEQAYYEALFEGCSRVMMSIVQLPQPVIARVHGLATAAGCQLVGACDLAVAAEGVRFAVSGVNLGLFCSTPSVALSRNVPRKRSFEMLVTGNFIDARTALDYGLVNRVCEAERLDETVGEIAASILNKPRVAVETGKRMFYQQLEKDLESAYRYAGHVMACNMMAEETVEGIDAFIEKREPRWS